MAKSRSSIGTVETVETNKSPERILWKAVFPSHDHYAHTVKPNVREQKPLSG